MTTLGNIRVTEERVWRVVRWGLSLAYAAGLYFAPGLWEYAQQLQAIPALRVQMAELNGTLIDQRSEVGKLSRQLAERSELDEFLCERIVAYEAADAESRPAHKAAAAREAVRVYREALERHSPKEALLIARATRR
jgi:hypothetical protein